VVTHEVLFLDVGVDWVSYVVRHIRSRPVRKGGVYQNLGRIPATAMEASDGGAAGLNAQDERLIEGSRHRKRNTWGEVPTKLGYFTTDWVQTPTNTSQGCWAVEDELIGGTESAGS
jgi:hypothetical protein